MAPTRGICTPLLAVLALLVALGAGCGGADTPAARGGGPRASQAPAEASGAGERGQGALAEAPLVVFLGDSLTAGLHLAQGQAFPALLHERLAAEGLPFRVVNAGVSGDTAAGGRRRIEWILRQRPDVVVVGLGANDGLRGGSLEALEEDLGGIVARARGEGALVLLLGMHLPPSYGEDYTRAFAELYARVARRTGVAFVPEFLAGVGGVPDMNLADQLHPNERGQARLADNVEPALRALLEELGAGALPGGASEAGEQAGG